MTQDISLKGKVALITGAGQGLGKAMTIALCDAGANVVAFERNKAMLDRLEAESNNAALGFAGDVKSEVDVANVVDLAVSSFGHIDIVVSNAGVGLVSIRDDYHTNPIPFWEVKPSTFVDFLDVNAVGFFRLAREVTPLMVSQGRGRIVTVTTSLGTMLRSGMFPYGASKAANESLAAAMVGDLTNTGVTVNVLVPGGAADTAFVPNGKGVERSSLISPDVMGPPIVWLASDHSDGFTGNRIVAKNWDSRLMGIEAARLSSSPIAWSSIVK